MIHCCCSQEGGTTRKGVLPMKERVWKYIVVALVVLTFLWVTTIKAK